MPLFDKDVQLESYLTLLKKEGTVPEVSYVLHTLLKCQVFITLKICKRKHQRNGAVAKIRQSFSFLHRTADAQKDV